VPRSRRSLAAWVAGGGLCLALVAAMPAAASARTSQGGRAYELVSPVDKNGGDVAADTGRTRAASDGGAVTFDSLTAFGDALGTGVATDYMSVRSNSASPGGSGWTTHALTPPVEANSLQRLLSRLDPLFVGEFSSDLNAGVFYSSAPITDDPSVAAAQNLYRRTDLRTPGAGTYELVTGCPLCDALSTPLAPSAIPGALPPKLAAATPDFSRIIFESEQPLASDTPPNGDVHLFEWSEAGGVQLVGRIPTDPDIECTDGGAPACTPAEASIAGVGAGTTNGTTHAPSLTPHTISDGSDGHTRIFFTLPTNSRGTATSPASYDGHVYMRVDDTSTVRLDVSETTPPAADKTARFLDASSDGTRVFFSTSTRMNDDPATPAGSKLYMYDATKPASAPDNLTLINADNEPAEFGLFRGLIGVSDDGHYVYFATGGQLVSGEPLLAGDTGIFLWHDGTITYIGRVPNVAGPLAEMVSSGSNYELQPRQARVTPDGKHLVFNAARGEGLTGYDHGPCFVVGSGCREFYVYSADTNTLRCASCNPSGAAATVMAETSIRQKTGGSQTTWHQDRTIADDGSRVFFSTVEALVPQDVNGRSDAYEYDVATGRPLLLSSGTSPYDSWFMDASADGRDAFFVTREQLVGWDRDQAYDLYDARIGGGFPEPSVQTACSGDACQGALGGAPALAGPATRSFAGGGNLGEHLRSRVVRRHAKRCKRGFVKKRVRDRRGHVKHKCVRNKRHRAKRAHAKLRRRGS
jgi:hypothetical protein